MMTSDPHKPRVDGLDHAAVEALALDLTAACKGQEIMTIVAALASVTSVVIAQDAHGNPHLAQRLAGLFDQAMRAMIHVECVALRETGAPVSNAAQERSA